MICPFTDFRRISDHDLRDPEPDPNSRRYAFRVDIKSGRKTLYDADGRPIIEPLPAPPSGRLRPARVCRTRRIAEEMLKQGVTDPWAIAAAAGVGVEAARRHLRRIVGGSF